MYTLGKKRFFFLFRPYSSYYLLVDSADPLPLIMSNRGGVGPDLSLSNPKTPFILLGLEFRSDKKPNGSNVNVSGFYTYLTHRRRMTYKQFLWPSPAFLLSLDLCSCRDAHCMLVLRSRGIHARDQAVRVPWDRLKHCIQRRIHLVVERC